MALHQNANMPNTSVLGRKVSFIHKYTGIKVDEAMLLEREDGMIVILSNYARLDDPGRGSFPDHPEYKYRWYIWKYSGEAEMIADNFIDFRFCKKLNHEE